MKEYYDIIIEPIITEKSNIQKEEAQQVTFRVPVHATKIQVRQAVEKYLSGELSSPPYL